MGKGQPRFGPDASHLLSSCVVGVEDFIVQRRVSKFRPGPEPEQQAKEAERDASRMIFCGDRVLVEAGDPVWYAILDRGEGRFDLTTASKVEDPTMTVLKLEAENKREDAVHDDKERG